jgi:hypothetical protein
VVVLGAMCLARRLFHESGRWKEEMADIRTTQVEWEDATGGEEEETVSEEQIATYSQYLLRSKRANPLIPAMLNPSFGPLTSLSLV